jgi:hypothetical protein
MTPSQVEAQTNGAIVRLEWSYYVSNLTSDLTFQIVTNNLKTPTDWKTMKAVRATNTLVSIINFTNTYRVGVTSLPPYNFFSVRASNSLGVSGLATK